MKKVLSSFLILSFVAISFGQINNAAIAQQDMRPASPNRPGVRPFIQPPFGRPSNIRPAGVGIYPQPVAADTPSGENGNGDPESSPVPIGGDNGSPPPGPITGAPPTIQPPPTSTPSGSLPLCLVGVGSDGTCPSGYSSAGLRGCRWTGGGECRVE